MAEPLCQNCRLWRPLTEGEGACENLDRVIEIAYREGVNPSKGFELILKQHGICSAITWYGSNPDQQSRQQCLRLLVRRSLPDRVRGFRVAEVL